MSIVVPLLWSRHRELDLQSVDDDTSRILGLPLERSRLVILIAAGILAGLVIALVGTPYFVFVLWRTRET